MFGLGRYMPTGCVLGLINCKFGLGYMSKEWHLSLGYKKAALNLTKENTKILVGAGSG